jgi:hypothetical protein
MKSQQPVRGRAAERAEHRTVVLLRASQRKKLNKAAEEQGVSMAEVIRRAVDDMDLKHKPFPIEDMSKLAKATLKSLANSTRQIDAARRALAEIRSRLSARKGNARTARSGEGAHGAG